MFRGPCKNICTLAKSFFHIHEIASNPYTRSVRLLTSQEALKTFYRQIALQSIKIEPFHRFGHRTALDFNTKRALKSTKSIQENPPVRARSRKLAQRMVDNFNESGKLAAQ